MKEPLRGVRRGPNREWNSSRRQSAPEFFNGCKTVAIES